MRPTEPGWYWYWEDDKEPKVVCVEWDGRPNVDALLITEADGEYTWPVASCPGTFLGPLVPPERPER